MNQQPRNRTNLRLEQLENRNLLAAVSIVADQDNSLFEHAQGILSNGAGEYLFAGQTGQPDGRNLRRGLIQFDLAGQVPEGATINSVSLSLTLSRAISDALPVSLHRVTESWGEGGSDAVEEEGRGADAAPGDATWLHTNFPTSTWSTPGGTFVADDSATTDVGAVNRAYIWSSEQMIADVQAWLENPNENHGWAVLGPESIDKSAKRFNSSEHDDVATRPTLTIDFDEPQAIPTLSVGDASAAEGDEPKTLRFEATISAQPTEEVSFGYATVDGSAVAGEDYESTSGSLSFGPNDPLTKTIEVAIIDDDEDELDETLLLQLGDPLGLELNQTEVTGTIEDDDDPERPWHNPELPLDTTGDGVVVPRDALLIINYINANGPGPLPPPGPDGPPPFLDVTGDNQITALDALHVINFININSAANALLASNSDDNEQDLK